jgi:hypothetical protein
MQRGVGELFDVDYASHPTPNEPGDSACMGRPQDDPCRRGNQECAAQKQAADQSTESSVSNRHTLSMVQGVPSSSWQRPIVHPTASAGATDCRADKFAPRLACYLEAMDLVMRLVGVEEVHAHNASLAYWLSRPPAERIAEVERLRREYMERLRGTGPHGDSEGLRGSLRFVERAQR